MRISVWSSCVCSSELEERFGCGAAAVRCHTPERRRAALVSRWTPGICERILTRRNRRKSGCVSRMEVVMKIDARLPAVRANQASADRLPDHETAAAAPETGAGFFISPMLRFDSRSITVIFEVRDSDRSEEHTAELQSLMRTPDAVFCLKKTR